MNDLELLAKYERMHAYFMADPRFWYEKGRQEADKIVCVLASNLRQKLREEIPGDYISDYAAYVSGFRR